MAIYNKQSIEIQIKEVELYENIIDYKYALYGEITDTEEVSERARNKNKTFMGLLADYAHEVIMLGIRVEDWAKSYRKDQYDEICEIVYGLCDDEVKTNYYALKGFARELKEVIK